MITFNTVRWKNFLSTGNNFTEIQLDRSETTLIVGENGAGKSTILDALCFGLYGKPFRVINKPQLVNSINTGATIVEVEFTIGTRKWKVIRGIKPNKFEIYCDDQMVNQDANSRDYQKYLEQSVLRLNYRSFTQVVILGSSTFVPFMQLKAQHRREVVEDILDIRIFSLMNMILKQKIRDLGEKVKDLDYEIRLQSEKISMQENHIEDLKTNKDEIISKRKDLLSESTKTIEERQASYELLQKEIAELTESILDSKKVDSKKGKLKELAVGVAGKHKRIVDEMQFFTDNEHCPTCDQDIVEEHRKTMVTSREESLVEVEEGIAKLKEELSSVEDRVKEINEISDKIRDKQISSAEVHSSVSELQRQVNDLKAEIDSFESGSVSDADLDKLAGLKTDADKLAKRKTELKEETHYLEAAKDMLQDSGIKTKIIKQYLPIMNQLINKYLASMEFYVNFNLDESFNETIKSRYRDDFTYSSFSEGEKMRIDLALLFTWRAVAKMKNSTNTNLLILDEIFDSSLDNTGTDEFLKILNTLGNENVFVISHKGDVLADKFRHSIRFEKVNNFSRIAQ